MLVVCIFGAIILFSREAKAAATATATLTINNSLPTASLMNINSSATDVTLNTGSTATVTVTFTVQDLNGCTDIDSNLTTKTKAVFYRTNITTLGYDCTPNDANCYAMSCTPTACHTSLTTTYSCTATVQFYADATDATAPPANGSTWTATAIPADNAGANTAGNNSSTIIMDTLTALGIDPSTPSISYTALALGADTASVDQPILLVNKGNRIIDAEVNGYGSGAGDITHSMVCTIGSIGIGMEKYSLTAAQDYTTQKVALTGSAYQLTGFDLAEGASASKNIYWGMGLPANGVGGTCSGSVVFTAVDHT